jgi:hypothetical protein
MKSDLKISFRNQAHIPHACPGMRVHIPDTFIVSAACRGDQANLGIRAVWETGRANAPGCGVVTLAISIPLVKTGKVAFVGARKADAIAVNTDPLIGESEPTQLTNAMVHGLLRELDELIAKNLNTHAPINLDASPFINSVYDVVKGITDDKFARRSELRLKRASVSR